MSGGHWNYEDGRACRILRECGTDAEVAQRFPRLAGILNKLGENLEGVLSDIDWDLSSDHHVDVDDVVFDARAVEQILAAVTAGEKAAAEEFERRERAELARLAAKYSVFIRSREKNHDQDD